MKLIVGLGNPGKKYFKTRHNMGFMVLDQFLKDFEPVNKTVWEDSSKFKSDIAEILWEGKEKIILAKPKTYMNNSGMAVKLLIDYFKIDFSDLWVVHDDVDLPPGSIKIRFAGASAGHKGVTSIIDSLGTDKFWRFRLGIGDPKHKFEIRNSKFETKGIDDYVLGKFTGGEWGKAKGLIKRCVQGLKAGLAENLEAAQNRFNAK